MIFGLIKIFFKLLMVPIFIVLSLIVGLKFGIWAFGALWAIPWTYLFCSGLRNCYTPQTRDWDGEEACDVDGDASPGEIRLQAAAAIGRMLPRRLLIMCICLFISLSIVRGSLSMYHRAVELGRETVTTMKSQNPDNLKLQAIPYFREMEPELEVPKKGKWL